METGIDDASDKKDCDEEMSKLFEVDKIEENEIPQLIHEELKPLPDSDATSGDEKCSDISLFDDSPGRKGFDKHILDVGVATRIIKGMQEFNEACKEAEGIPSVTNLKDTDDETKQDIPEKNGENHTGISSEKNIEEDSTNILPPLFSKVHQGLLELYELIDDGKESVTNIRVAAIRNEIERQKEDECERFALEGYIAKKELEALEEYEKITEKWETISNLKDPLNIHNETILQREKCNALLEEKDKVIEYLREMLKKKDNIFLKEVEDQGSEIDLLIDRIEQQISILKDAYTNQLEKLEEIIDEEKKLMIESNRAKWESLIKYKDEVEKGILKKLSKIMDNHESVMRLTEKEQNEYQRKVRSKLNKYINDLTIQVDHLKSICTLNIEKMTYNYQLLFKKLQENQLIKQTCKRTVARLTNNVAEINKKIEEENQIIAHRLIENATKLDKLQESISSVKKRFESLSISNSKVYFDLFAFNEKKAQNIVEQILVADQLMYQELLLMPWSPPDLKHLDKSLIPSYKEAMKVCESLKKKNKFETRKLPAIENGKLTIHSNRVTKVVLNAIRSACPFFIQQERRDDISRLQSKDQYLLELESIFEALGVKTKDDVEDLINHFLPHIQCEECVVLSQEDKITDEIIDSIVTCWNRGQNKFLSYDKEIPEVNEVPKAEKTPPTPLSAIVRENIDSIKKLYNEVMSNSDVSQNKFMSQDFKSDSTFNKTCTAIENLNICSDTSHHLFVNPHDVATVLRDFTIGFYKTKEKDKNLTLEEVMDKPVISPSRMINPNEVSEYWKSYTDLFPPQKVELWETMLYAVQDYYKALNKRHHLNNEVKKLHKSNLELRRLLQRYIEKSSSV